MSGDARVPGPRGAHAQPSEVPALPTPGPTSMRDSLDVLANIQRASRRLSTAAATSAPTEGEADCVGHGQRHESTNNNSSSTSARAALTTPSSHQALLAAHDASMLSLQYRGGLPGGEEAAAGRRSLSPPESVGTAAPRRSSSSDPGHLNAPPPLTSLPARSALTTAASRASPLADAGVTQIQLSPYASRLATDNAPRTVAPAAPSPATPAEELLRTRQQLAELQRLYSFEKKAQLQQRAQQLRHAAEQQHEDGDVVAQATQIVAEYEALVRLRADASRAQLETTLRRVAEAWKTEAVQLEHTRAACEADLLQRLEASVVQQREVLSQQLQRHLIAVAHATVEAERGQEAAVAAAVQEQVSAFKDEYRRLLEQDMHERQRLMDAQVAHREAQWRTFLKEEHARMIAAGEAAAQELSRRQRESLHLALRDMTELRQRLLDENAQRQARTAQEYLVAYENLAGEHATAALEAVEYVQQLQHDYAAVIRALHADVRRATAEKQEAERRLEQSAVQVAEAVAHELHVVEEKAEARWRHRWEAEQEAHRGAVAQLTRTHAEALESARHAAADTEAQLQRAHERALASLHDQLTRQQASEAARTAAALQRTQATVERLEHEKAELRSALQASKDEQRSAELVHAAALLETQRASEAKYATQLAELEATYDDVVLHYKEKVHAAAATASSPTSAAATATASAAALRRVVELEKEVQELTAQHAQAVRQAASEAAALWSGRLDAARTQHRADAEELEGQHRELRQRLLDEAARREAEMEERCVALRQSHAAELRDAVSREKAAAQAATSRLERQIEVVQREAAAAAQAHVQACEDAMRVRDEQLVAAQAAWQRRRVEESDQLSRALTQQAATQLAEQAGELESREAALRAAQAALAQQQASALRDARTTARREAEERLAEQQRAAEAAWLTLMHAELHNRYVSWQESRAQELAMLRAAHRDELQLLHGYYAAQLSNAHEAQRQCLEAERKAMQEREAAWAATRAAALSDHRTGVAEVLREVLATEEAVLEAARERQREQEPHIREAALSAVAAHLRERTAASVETTARLEADMRARYVAVLEQQESAASAMLAEQRQAHEDALAQLHSDVATAAAAQASRAAQEAARSEAAHRAHVLELTKAYEQRLAEQRTRHDAALAAERTAAQERTARVQEELDAAREMRAQAAASQAQDLHRAYAQQVAELQARCETLTTQLRGAETASHLSTLQVRQEQEAKLRSEYEASIASLRDALEERNHAYAALQTSLYTRVQAEVDRVQASGAEKLADFMAGQQQQLADALAAHEAALVALQQRHQEALAAQRHTHEQALQAQVSRLRDTHAAALAAQQAQWATHEARWTALLEDERRARSAAEERANAAAVTQAQSRVSEAEQQAAAYRHLDDEYRDLLEHLRDDVHAEREELARRSLENEEHRFVSAMLHQRQRAQQQQPQQQQQQNRAEQEARTRAAPQRSPQPPRRRRPAASRLSTPVAPRAQEMPSSPLAISPAAPVELTHAVDVPQYDEQQTDDGGTQLVRAATPRLRQLWDVLEVPLEEQQAFISHAEALAHAQEQRHWAADRPTSAPASLVELRSMLTHEQRRLEAQLPLLEALTRREYVQRQLRSLAPTSAPPSLASLPLNVPLVKEQHDEADDRSRNTGGADDVFEDGAETTMRSSSSAVSAAVSPPVKQQQQQRSSAAAGQLSRMQDELQRLTAQLRLDVTQHEKLYGQLFCLSGRRVMETL